MPTFKHPCPHCGKFIERDAAACPYCATRDPFAPARCPNCRTVIEDPSWLACPRCGQPVGAAAAAAQHQQAPGNQPPPSTFMSPTVPPTTSPTPQPGPLPATPAPPPAPQSAAAKCTGCGAPLAPGARFCTVCGTLAG